MLLVIKYKFLPPEAIVFYTPYYTRLWTLPFPLFERLHMVPVKNLLIDMLDVFSNYKLQNSKWSRFCRIFLWVRTNITTITTVTTTTQWRL